METKSLHALLWAVLLFSSFASADYVCHSTFYGIKPGVITSRGFPDKVYPANENCLWKLQPGAKGTLRLSMTYFQMASTYNCPDRVLVHLRDKKDLQERELYRLCYGASMGDPKIPVDEDTTITINFITTYGGANGFRLVYYFETQETERTTIKGNTAIMQPFPEPERKPNVDEHDQVLVGCESDRFGASCEDSCGGGLEGCSSKEICTAYCSIDEAISNNSIAAIFRCSCAAGLKGARCDEVCSPGHYGSNCSLLCGFCKDHERCNRFTGECNNGCQAGYYPPFCQQELTHLRRGLTISSNSNTSFSGLILVAPSNVAGAGEVTMYELQYKEIQGGRWTSGAFGQIEPCRENPCSFVVDGLRPDTDLAVRALLLNDNMESFDNYLYLTTRTLGQRQVSGLTVTNVTARSLRVSWTSPADGPFCVMYGCDTMLACPGMRCDYSDGMLCDANKSVLLENLFPFTRYSITVAIDDQSETISAITLATVPDAEVSDLATRHITNVTAVVRWQNTDSCAQLNGPFSNYRWELYPWEDPKDRASNDLAIDAAPLRFGATNSLAVVFRDLKPLTWHMFRVNIINALGPNPRRWSLLPFKTLHTVPEAPREPAVYRNNGTSLWLRWQKPARPYGIITRYIVELQGPEGTRKETASPNSHCVAKVDFICHTWNGLHPDTDYIIVIRAANEYGDEPGEPTTVHGSTRMGDSGPPQYLRVKELHPRSVVLEWQLPDLLNSDLHYFELVISPRKGMPTRPRRFELQNLKEQLWYEYAVDGLQPGAVYSAEVRCGWRGAMALIHFTTLSE